ncbi:MAG: hypothetical protein HQK79_10790 [Desulfobacterales bacterium]|nr:hypothetical protein [Desulfobacterales bacterium]MBF0396496.1 hypothetical protein [Desulfobacterales bacterium]
MEDVNKILKNIGNVFKILSFGIEAMVEKTNEIIDSLKDDEVKEEEYPKEAPAATPENIKDVKVTKQLKKKVKANKASIKDKKVKKSNPKNDLEKEGKKKYSAKKEESLKETTFESKASIEKAPKPRKKINKEVNKKSLRGKKSYKKESGATMTDTILKIFDNSSEPISVSDIVEMTGFVDRPIQDVIYRQIKKGKIKKAGDKLYTKA